MVIILKEITYSSKNGTVVTLKLKKKVIGDMKLISSLLGHRGQSSSYPCYACNSEWALHGTDILRLEDVDFSVKPTERTLASYANDSKCNANGVKSGSTPLCQVEPLDYGIPTVHTVLGIFNKYFENHINGEINSMDRKDDKSAKSLKEHKKNHAKMLKEEKRAKEDVDKFINAKEEAYCTATAYRLISQNPLSHLKTPEPLCESSICVINHLAKNRKSDDWIRCDSCKNYYHFACCALFSPELKLLVSNQKIWKCNVCENWDFAKHQSEAMKELNKLGGEVQIKLNDLSELTKKRSDLEGLLFRSTGTNRQKLESLLESIGCGTRSWYQTLNGNQVRTILRESNIDEIFKLLRDNPLNVLVKKAMKGLGRIMSISNSRHYTDAEIDSIEEILKEFLQDMKIAFPKESVTPKLHLIAFHLIPYLRKHHSWGKTCEQGIEHFHAQFNNLKRIFNPIRNLSDRAHLIVQEIGILNWLHDTGFFNDSVYSV